MTDLDAIRARHVPLETAPGWFRCKVCGMYWEPDTGCDTAIVLAALDAQTAIAQEEYGLAARRGDERDAQALVVADRDAALDEARGLHAAAHDALAAAIEREARLRAALSWALDALDRHAYIPQVGDKGRYAALYNEARAALATTPEGER